MEWVVTTGRSVEEALETALDQLGVDEHDAEVEVMQQPQRGLFRRIRSEARIRARVRPSVPPPKLDHRDRRRRDRNGRDGGRARSRPKGQSTNGRAATGGQKVAKGRDGGRGRAKDRGKAPAATGRERSDGAAADQDAAAGSATVPGGRSSGDTRAQEPGKTGSRSQRRRRSRRRGGKPEAEGAQEVSDSTATDTERPVLDIEAQRAAVEEFLQGLVGAFDRKDVTVTTTVDDETIDAAVEGPELGLLVGQKGVTLQALQELVRSVVQRQFVGQSHARVRVDVSGYRARRREALERFTLEVVESVRSSGVAKALDPMGAADRKIVHDAVNPLDGVETVSEGEDAARRVVIRPV